MHFNIRTIGCVFNMRFSDILLSAFALYCLVCSTAGDPALYSTFRFIRIEFLSMSILSESSFTEIQKDIWIPNQQARWDSGEENLPEMMHEWETQYKNWFE